MMMNFRKTLLLSAALIPFIWADSAKAQNQDVQENQTVVQDSSEAFYVDVEALPPQPSQSTTVPTAEVSGAAVEAVLTPPPSESLADPTINAEPSNAGTVQRVPHSGQYYDAGAVVPSSGLRSSVGPREVDPKYEPGSSFVVVRKTAGPKSRQARIIAAQRALSLGRYTAALELYEGLYKKMPKNKQILMGLAVAQQRSGFTESAIATYEELLKISPNDADATVNMLGLLREQYPAVAHRKLKDLWHKNSRNPAVAAQLGLSSASNGNTEEAIRYLGVAASLEPDNASHYYNMAVVSDQAGAYKDAMDLYEKALEVDVARGTSRSVPRDAIYDRLADLRRL